jgi:hypothetical protein
LALKERELQGYQHPIKVLMLETLAIHKATELLKRYIILKPDRGLWLESIRKIILKPVMRWIERLGGFWKRRGASEDVNALLLLQNSIKPMIKVLGNPELEARRDSVMPPKSEECHRTAYPLYR